MNLYKSLTRSADTLTFDQWADYFNFNGLSYPFIHAGTQGEPAQEIGSDFAGYVQGIYRSNGVVFACMAARMLLFAEARFQFRTMRNGRPGDLFGTKELGPLEKPWKNGTTGDMLSRAIQDADLAGNWFARRQGDKIIRMRPDWVTIVAGSESGDIGDAEPVGYLYHPGGPRTNNDPLVLLPEQVAHFAPIPDPFFRFRGMSWLTPVIREIMADGAATTHKLRFFENGATPNMVVTLDQSINPEKFDRWVAKFKQGHEGIRHAYKTLFLGGGADAKVVGADMKQIDFKVTQGAGETRIAAASGVPPVIVGLSEGLAASTYSNYSQARRRFADGTMRPLWRNFAGSLAPLINVPNGAELWYDDRDISFLQEDQKDAADIQSVQASTIHTLVTSGYHSDSVIKAVTGGDFNVLEHSGLFSVQLQAAGAVGEGAGSVVKGVPTPTDGGKAAPAAAGTNAASLVVVARAEDPVRHGAHAVAFVNFDVEWREEWPLVDLPQMQYAPVEGQYVEIRRGDAIEAGHPMIAAYPKMFRQGMVLTPLGEGTVDREPTNNAEPSGESNEGRVLRALLTKN